MSQNVKELLCNKRKGLNTSIQNIEKDQKYKEAVTQISGSFLSYKGKPHLTPRETIAVTNNIQNMKNSMVLDLREYIRGNNSFSFFGSNYDSRNHLEFAKALEMALKNDSSESRSLSDLAAIILKYVSGKKQEGKPINSSGHFSKMIKKWNNMTKETAPEKRLFKLILNEIESPEDKLSDPSVAESFSASLGGFNGW